VERERALVARQHLSGVVRGSVVVHDDRERAVELAQDLTHLPHQDADGRGLVVGRYTDIDHGG
jgi:hypothetical protein